MIGKGKGIRDRRYVGKKGVNAIYHIRPPFIRKASKPIRIQKVGDLIENL
jgi:hypothetical protein